MEPVIGLDVSKGSSVFQAFTGRNEAWGETEVMVHEAKGFGRLKACVEQLQEQTSQEPVVILEATGHYHRGLVNFLVQQGIRHCIVNPLQSKRARGTKLRKVKTDAADAWHLAEMYYRGEILPHRTPEDVYTELQHVTRQHEFVTGLYVQAKLNTRALLDQVFPAFEGIFYNLYSETALRVLECCLRGQEDRVYETMEKTAGQSHAKWWVEEKAQRVEEALSEWHQVKVSSSQVYILEGMLSLLHSLQEQLKRLEKQMQELSMGMPETELLRTIPGIGEKLAATLVAELGDIRQFESPKQLVAYAGLDPGVFNSGKFTASSNRITKRGSKRLRRALYLAVQCSLRRGDCSKLRPYYDKKKKEGKPYKVAVIACANKLLHHIYAILRKGQPYQV
ncbi:IS110 family transposase [Paenibacillus sabinae]|uniref:Transposase IS116/IS110/IS902 family protein n=1 Tax=Paenibacillus sabinae T27 TaxID=1268072 RepID=X4ZR68_9BACL|nr:IS110 family transposase [Paenibacillus sabinae]AHV97654.1 transposase IS116/IS110/IS902 family protein [Paenibacillus sabinae T27]AHV98955.1 transposase IS116/IS110/IS902 family protein [Paenibacillus sabinae T27]